MKILCITSTYPRFQGDGVGSFIHSLCYNLTKLGHSVQVFAPYDPLVDPTWQPGVSVERIRYIWPNAWSVLGHARSLKNDMSLKWHAFPLVALFSLMAIPRLCAAMRRARFDVIYASWLVPGGFIGAVVAQLTGAPLVVHLHGSDIFVAERYKILRPIIRFTLSKARHVIACSTDLATRVTRFGLSPERVTVVPNGVEIERYLQSPELPECLSDWGTRNIVMGMGRLVSKKGFVYLLRSAPFVLKRFPNTLFVIAGEGDLRAELEAFAKKLGIQEYVLFVGHIPWDQTPVYLKAADVFVVPSIRDEAGNVDGLPSVLLEAMAAGCAVVASHIAGIPEVICDGENGLLVPPGDEIALSEKICLLLGDGKLRKRLGEAAKKTVATRYRWIQIAEQVAAILETAVQPSC
ncbi:MAG: glycosyltransferase [Candidatus Bathyarchaeia archaeon]